MGALGLGSRHFLGGQYLRVVVRAENGWERARGMWRKKIIQEGLIDLEGCSCIREGGEEGGGFA